MNQHTAKLLKKHARNTENDFRQVKKWWETLDWKQRTVWRAKIQASLATNEAEEVETVETTQA